MLIIPDNTPVFCGRMVVCDELKISFFPKKWSITILMCFYPGFFTSFDAFLTILSSFLLILPKMPPFLMFS